jgi:Histidine kinase-, DNA gyrase B-, and HSP90-like ATPase
VSQPTFSMRFEPVTIEHLGLNLYGSLPPVVGELVSNSYDADSPWVKITIPEGNITPESEVIIKDHGYGMDESTLQNAFLRIGRKKRDEEGSETSPKGRKLMGRKGLGKLAAFGVADEVEIRTVREGNAVCILLNFPAMKETRSGTEYEPSFIQEKSGPTTDDCGTNIVIRKLRRTKPIDVKNIKKELARRFTIIGDEFKVYINDEEITPKDRRLKEDCKRVWDVKDIPPGGALVDIFREWEVTGWIGLVEKSSQVDRGVDIFARGKAVELDTMFSMKTTSIQLSRAYIVGEIHAEFLDEEYDRISTPRNAAQWDSEEGLKLQEWGQRALKFVMGQWLAFQKEEKEKKIVKTEDFDRWMENRSSRERKVAIKLIKILVNDENVEAEAAKPYLDMIKTNIELLAFQDLVDDIEETGANAPTLMKLFNDWEIIEAREALKLSDGRMEIVQKLVQLVKDDALEVQEMQPLFEKYGWLINPKWTHVTGQNRYSKLLRDNCKEPKDLEDKDRRMDILGYSAQNMVQVVELKRPGKKLSYDDLTQIERYVDWARGNLIGSGPDSPKYISGLLIVGEMNDDGEIERKLVRLAGNDIRVEIYDHLLDGAESIYGELEEILKAQAPEYTRKARRDTKKQRLKLTGTP